MAEVSFPNEWRIWTQPQREAMFRDWVMETCRQRGYSAGETFYREISGKAPTNLSGHVSAFMVKNRSRMDTYDHTKSVARFAAFHICPERSGGAPSGSSSGKDSGPMAFARGAVSLLLPWLGPPPEEAFAPDPAAARFAFGGVIVWQGEDPPDAAPIEWADSPDASPFDPFGAPLPPPVVPPFFAGPALLDIGDVPPRGTR